MIKIQLPIVLIGDGEICKYSSLECAESDLEAYDIDLYVVYDASYRKVVLFKKDKYCRVGFRIDDDEFLYDEFVQEIKKFMQIYDFNENIKDFIDKIPIYPNC